MSVATLSSVLSEYKIYLLTAHILGTVLGMGGATIADLLFFRFLHDFRISAKEFDVMRILKTAILSALGLIILTGIGLYFADMDVYAASGPFRAKMLIVGIITINGVGLHLVVAPHLLRLDMKRYHKRYRTWRRFAFALGGVSACSWYSAFFIAMMKSVLPQTFSFLFGGYLIILGVTLVTSQLLEMRLSRMARK